MNDVIIYDDVVVKVKFEDMHLCFSAGLMLVVNRPPEKRIDLLLKTVQNI